MKAEVLDERMSSTNRASASDRTIKISASIATTLWIKTECQKGFASIYFPTATYCLLTDLLPIKFLLGKIGDWASVT
jgi:hypothetical protein